MARTIKRALGAAAIVAGTAIAGGGAGVAMAGVEPAITATPSITSGPSDSEFTIDGDGCVDRGYGANVVAFMVADSGAGAYYIGDAEPGEDGVFSIEASLVQEEQPELTPFTYPVFVTCTIFNSYPYSDTAVAQSTLYDEYYAEFDFTVTVPQQLPESTGDLGVEPATVEAGGTVAVTGPALSTPPGETEFNDGFVPGQAVKLVLYPGAVEVGTATADGNGLLSTDVAIPANTAPGDYTLVGFGKYETVAPGFTALTAALTVTPAPFVPPPTPPEGEPLTGLSATTVAPGGSLTIVEEGFIPDEDVPVVLYSTPKVLTTAKADATGKVTVTVVIPPDTTPGSHQVALFGARTTKVGPITVLGQEGTTTTATTAARPGATLARSGPAANSGPADGPWTAAALGLVLAGFTLVIVGRERRMLHKVRRRR